MGDDHLFGFAVFPEIRCSELASFSKIALPMMLCGMCPSLLRHWGRRDSQETETAADGEGKNYWSLNWIIHDRDRGALVSVMYELLTDVNMWKFVLFPNKNNRSMQWNITLSVTDDTSLRQYSSSRDKQEEYFFREQTCPEGLLGVATMYDETLWVNKDCNCNCNCNCNYAGNWDSLLSLESVIHPIFLGSALPWHGMSRDKIDPRSTTIFSPSTHQ